MDAQQYFQNLALAAMVDGKLDDSELVLLESHAENLRLSSDQAQRILNGVCTGELTEFVKPKSPEARKAAFKAVARILRADKVITSQEQRMLKLLGLRMEIPDDLIDKALGKK